MRHELERANIIIITGLIIFITLFALFSYPGSLEGRASLRTTVNITDSTPANCTFFAYAGHNTISVPCIATAEAIRDVVPADGVWAMYQYVPGSPDQWKVDNPTLPSYVVNDLQFLSRRAGYVLVMNESRSYEFEGLLVFSTDIPVVSGWNLVGYPTNETRNASDAFSGINTTLHSARTYNNSIGTYEIYINPSGGTLNTTIPGEGYWLNMSTSDTWTVVG